MRVIGVDPGSIKCGWGVVEKRGNKFIHIEHGVIDLDKNEALSERLALIFKSISKIIENYKPATLAIEKSFLAKNVSVAMKLGQVRGVVIAASALKNLKISEYSPNEIKLSLVGFGHSSKAQLQKMTKTLLNLSDLPKTDAADAIAVGICHLQQSRLTSIITTMGKRYDRLSSRKFVSKRSQ